MPIPHGEIQLDCPAMLICLE